MSFLSLAKSRFSVRKYTKQPISQEDLDYILESGRVAPTAVNYQPFHVYVLRSEEALKKLPDCSKCFQPNVALIICTDTTKAWARPIDGYQSLDVDASIVTDHMMLAATDKGIGSVWIGYFDIEKLRKAYNIPAHLRPTSILNLGHTEEISNPDRHDTKRQPLTELISYL